MRKPDYESGFFVLVHFYEPQEMPEMIEFYNKNRCIFVSNN